jgi:hypothetical protein
MLGQWVRQWDSSGFRPVELVMLRQTVRQSVLSVRSWLFLALLACVAVMTSFPAHAGGNVSVGIGYWSGPGYHHHYRGHRHGGHWGPRYRSSVMIYPAPVYYPPPRPVYYPAYPVYPAPVPVVQATQQCMQYNGDATIDGSGQPFYGRACLFTDGRWHIVP